MKRAQSVPMTWNDAAEKVLKTEKKALHYKGLAQKILEQKLVETEGKTPHVTLHASISLENKARQERGISPRFSIERGEVKLTAWETLGPSSAFFQQAAAERGKVKTELLKKLRQLSGAEFEGYIEVLLVKMGYQNVEVRGGPSDEGIDLLCEMSQGINQVKTAVQSKCKQTQNKVGPKDVRLLRDVLPKFKCSQGVLITTSTFTPQAHEAASEEGRLPIILIDGEKLSELAIEHEAGVKSRSIKVYSLDEDFELFSGSSSGAPV